MQAVLGTLSGFIHNRRIGRSPDSGNVPLPTTGPPRRNSLNSRPCISSPTALKPRQAAQKPRTRTRANSVPPRPTAKVVRMSGEPSALHPTFSRNQGYTQAEIEVSLPGDNSTQFGDISGPVLIPRIDEVRLADHRACFRLTGLPTVNATKPKQRLPTGTRHAPSDRHRRRVQARRHSQGHREQSTQPASRQMLRQVEYHDTSLQGCRRHREQALHV